MFKQWEKDADQKYDFSTEVHSDFKLTAKYLVGAIAAWTVKFTKPANYPADQPWPTNKTVVSGGKVSAPVVGQDYVYQYIDNGITYTFDHWDLNGKTYDFNTPVTGNINLQGIYTTI